MRATGARPRSWSIGKRWCARPARVRREAPPRRSCRDSPRPEAERLFAKRMDATPSEVPSSHVAMVSRPDDVATMITSAAAAVPIAPYGRRAPSRMHAGLGLPRHHGAIPRDVRPERAPHGYWRRPSGVKAGQNVFAICPAFRVACPHLGWPSPIVLVPGSMNREDVGWSAGAGRGPA